MATLYVECEYWVIGYAEGDELCAVELEGPFRGRKKKKTTKQITAPPPDIRQSDDDLVMAIVACYLEEMV